jgi:hypothetical protein
MANTRGHFIVWQTSIALFLGNRLGQAELGLTVREKSRAVLEPVAEELVGTVILRSYSDEESRLALEIVRARSFAALRMSAFVALRVTVSRRFSAA